MSADPSTNPTTPSRSKGKKRKNPDQPKDAKGRYMKKDRNMAEQHESSAASPDINASPTGHEERSAVEAPPTANILESGVRNPPPLYAGPRNNEGEAEAVAAVPAVIQYALPPVMASAGDQIGDDNTAAGAQEGGSKSSHFGGEILDGKGRGEASAAGKTSSPDFGKSALGAAGERHTIAISSGSSTADDSEETDEEGAEKIPSRGRASSRDDSGFAGDHMGTDPPQYDADDAPYHNGNAEMEMDVIAGANDDPVRNDEEDLTPNAHAFGGGGNDDRIPNADDPAAGDHGHGERRPAGPGLEVAARRKGRPPVPIVRPSARGEWYSKTPEEWARCKGPMRKKFSHIGRLHEGYGVRVVPCPHCRSIHEECWVYAADAGRRLGVGQRGLGGTCSQCRYAGNACPYNGEEFRDGERLPEVLHQRHNLPREEEDEYDARQPRGRPTMTQMGMEMIHDMWRENRELQTEVRNHEQRRFREMEQRADYWRQIANGEDIDDD